MVVGIIPAEVETTKLRTCPINGGFVVVLERGEEMECILAVRILDAKVVHAEAESYFSRAVTPEANSMGNGMVPVV